MKATIKDGKLLLEIPLEKGTPSKSGKMNLVASTGGWTDLGASHEGKVIRANIMVGYNNG